MQRLNPVLRTASKLLTKAPSSSFCFFSGTLDPSKHITMSHNPNNIYIDAIDIGQYEEVVALCSIAPRTYEPQVLSLTAAILNKRYGSSITTQELEQFKDKSWSRFLKKHVKTEDKIGSIYPSLLNQLAKSIIVRESRWTWIREQKERLIASSQYVELEDAETVGEFLEKYNQLIERLVLFSNLGHSKISQPPSTLEKHFVDEMTSMPIGVVELQEDREQNKNVINILMKYIHS